MSTQIYVGLMVGAIVVHGKETRRLLQGPEECEDGLLGDYKRYLRVTHPSMSREELERRLPMLTESGTKVGEVKDKALGFWVCLEDEGLAKQTGCAPMPSNLLLNAMYGKVNAGDREWAGHADFLAHIESAKAYWGRFEQFVRTYNPAFFYNLVDRSGILLVADYR